MSRELVVAVVQGGPSSEAEVSRASAQGVAAALVAAGHRAVRLELDAWLPESLRTGGFDVVFPVVHGAVGEDGSLQGLLELLELPYVGSGVLASALAMDKGYARRLFALDGLPVARGTEARAAEGAEAAADRVLREIGPRLVVKPASNGSAIGVTRLGEGTTPADVARALEETWRLGDRAVVEHFAHGREVTCGVLEIGGVARALPPTEVLAPDDAFYTYEARYAAGRSRHICPAELGGALVERVQELALRAHRVLGCRDLSRVDFVVGDRDAPEACFVLEVNTLPGMTATSLYPEAAAVHGLTFSALCDTLAAGAHLRGASRRNVARPLPRSG